MRRALLLAVLAWAACAQAQLRTEPEVHPGTPAPFQAKTYRLPPARVGQARLEAFTPPPAEPARAGAPLRIGHPREVAALQSPQSAAQGLQWEPVAGGGQKAALSVTSPGAAATRLALRIAAAPAGAVFRFYPPNGESPYEISYAEIAGQMRAGSSAGQAHETYWSPVVEGETQVVEVELAAGSATSELQLAIPLASHLTSSAANEFATAKAAASCNLDAMCYQDAWSIESNAVARIVFTDAGSSYVCTGTLLADRDTTSAIPYFLTANHCVNSQAVASTVQTFWFYRANGCNTGVRANSQSRTGGATLLYAAAGTDTSFMRLNTAPPAGVAYAGWQVGATSTIGTAVTGLHHPTGDLLKISFGSVRGYRNCSARSDDGFSCTTAPANTSSFYQVAWTRGTTETGSSGSGLFLDAGRYLVGQLYGGTGTCETSPVDYYGRLDVAYNAALSHWLGAASAPTAPVPEFDYSDMWWNPSESGWGLSITQHTNVIFAAWYVYDAVGNPTWVVMPGGTWTSSTTYTGEIYTAVGPDPRGTFDPARVSRTLVGNATLKFTARDRGTLAYAVNGVSGSKSIARQPFGPPDLTPVPNYGDLWWSPSESGWGLSISQQYRTLFLVWYAYRDSGDPVWYVVPGGTWTSADTYSGTVYRASAAPGRFYGETFDPTPVTRIPVGSMTLRFFGSASATMTYTVDGVSGSKSLTRQPF